MRMRVNNSPGFLEVSVRRLLKVFWRLSAVQFLAGMDSNLVMTVDKRLMSSSSDSFLSILWPTRSGREISGSSKK